MRSYSTWEKVLHKIYLGNYFISSTSLSLELSVHRLPKEKITHTYVTGLARSGTTALTRLLYSSDNFASLTYQHMPLLLMPITWSAINSRNSKISVERDHKDGIFIDQRSPEALEEYFWKVLLRDKYIQKNGLATHTITEKDIKAYQKYTALVCKGQSKNYYLAKNNNLILRLPSLLKSLPNIKVVIMIRDPWQHAHSLMKKHNMFCEIQKEDPFVLDYFNYLGHHEFGQNHKPFLFTPLPAIATNDINYWLQHWYNYYSYMIKYADINCLFIRFEDLCTAPKKATDHLNGFLKVESQITAPPNYYPPTYPKSGKDNTLLIKCMDLYNQILKECLGA
jgi:hypothetical protein